MLLDHYLPSQQQHSTLTIFRGGCGPCQKQSGQTANFACTLGQDEYSMNLITELPAITRRSFVVAWGVAWGVAWKGGGGGGDVGIFNLKTTTLVVTTLKHHRI